MKELSIEQKAEAYDKGLQKSKEFYTLCKKCGAKDTVDFLESLFPELRESEDERIRKRLCAVINDIGGNVLRPYLLTKDKVLAWLEKQDIFSKKDIDDAYLKGVRDTKNEIEKQYEANYQIRKDIATFIFNYKGDIKDRVKWMNYLGIKVSFVEKQGEQPQGKSELEAIREDNVDNQNRVNPADKVVRFEVGEWITNGEYIWKIVDIKPSDYILQSQDGNIVDDTISHVDEQFHSFTIEDARDGDVLSSPSHNIILIYKDSNHYYVGVNMNYVTGNVVINGLIEIPSDVCPATKDECTILFANMKKAGFEWNAEQKELKKIKSNSAWSEKDTFMYNKIKNLLTDISLAPESRNSFFDWLKSLKEGYTWKPSKEQMDALAWALSLAKNCGEECAFDLRTLHEQLEKLK